MIAKPLTPMQERLLDLVCRGKTDRQIAEAVGMTEGNVSTNLWRLGNHIGIPEGYTLRRALLAMQYAELKTLRATTKVAP